MQTSSDQKLPGTFIPLAIGLIGLFLGALALYLILADSSKDEAEIRSSERILFLEEQVQLLSSTLRDYEAEIDAIKSDIIILRAVDTKKVETPALVVTPEVQEPLHSQAYHIIESGDTLSRLAILYDVTIKQIEQANPGLDPLHLQLGQKINIPQL